MKKKKETNKCKACKKRNKKNTLYCSLKCYSVTIKNIEFRNDDLQKATANFEKKTIKNEDGCWSWKSKYKPTYGKVSFNTKVMSSHRFSYFIHKGTIPTGMLICHTCDNPPCTNPDHLFLGTHKDNCHDKMRKKRSGTRKRYIINKDILINIKKKVTSSPAFKPGLPKLFKGAIDLIYTL